MQYEINPIQFVEGINEGTQPAQEKFIQVREYPWVAIQYSSNHTFSLYKINICLVWGQYIEPAEYKVQLLSNYNKNPTDIILSEGKLIFDKTESGFGWRPIELSQPVVVMSGNTYWISLESELALYDLLRAEEGTDITMKAYLNKLWSSGSDNKYKLMLRFYGRVL